jgi:hypothetical protein
MFAGGLSSPARLRQLAAVVGLQLTERFGQD